MNMHECMCAETWCEHGVHLVARCEYVCAPIEARCKDV